MARRLEESRRIQEGMVRDLARQERLAALESCRVVWLEEPFVSGALADAMLAEQRAAAARKPEAGGHAAA